MLNGTKGVHLSKTNVNIWHIHNKAHAHILHSKGDINILNYWKQLQEEMCDYSDTTGQREAIFVSCLCIYNAGCGCIWQNCWGKWCTSESARLIRRSSQKGQHLLHLNAFTLFLMWKYMQAHMHTNKTPPKQKHAVIKLFTQKHTIHMTITLIFD